MEWVDGKCIGADLACMATNLGGWRNTVVMVFAGNDLDVGILTEAIGEGR